MAAITISRELGSLGSQIAQHVADHLGYRAVWRKIINEAARRSGAPEVALAEIDELGLLGVRPSYKASCIYHQAVGQILEELANEGDVVIVGRAGQVILHGRPDVLHVRVTAPLELRIERIVAADGISREAARARVEDSDRNRSRHLRRHYHVDWSDPTLYDLVLNTERLTVPAATALIAEALSHIPQPPPRS